MPGEVGRDVSFTWDGVEILGVQEKAINRTGNAIDVTSDEDDGHRTLLTKPSVNETNISLSGTLKSDKLANDFASGARTKPVVITYPNGRTITGTFFLQSYNETAPSNDAVKWTAECLSTGEVVETPGL